MTELNHNLDGLRLGGIRRYTALANQVGGCVMLTLGEPEFDTPCPSGRLPRHHWTEAAPTIRKTGEARLCVRTSRNLSNEAGAFPIRRTRCL